MNKVTFDEADDIIDICQDNVLKAVFTKDSPESEMAMLGFLSEFTGRKISVITIVANEPPIDNIRNFRSTGGHSYGRSSIKNN